MLRVLMPACILTIWYWCAMFFASLTPLLLHHHEQLQRIAGVEGALHDPLVVAVAAVVPHEPRLVLPPPTAAAAPGI